MNGNGGDNSSRWAKFKDQVQQFKWPLEKVVFCGYSVLLNACLFHWLIDENPLGESDDWKEWARSAWVLGWLILLVGLWRLHPTSAWTCTVLATMRLLEIYVTGLGTILDLKEHERARNVLTIIVYVAQVTFIFAILCYNLAADSFKANPDQISIHREVASSVFDFLYISWSNVTSLGNEYVAQTGFSRFLEVFTTTTGIFLLGVLLAFGINELKKPPKPACSESGR